MCDLCGEDTRRDRINADAFRGEHMSESKLRRKSKKSDYGSSNFSRILIRPNLIRLFVTYT